MAFDQGSSGCLPGEIGGQSQRFVLVQILGAELLAGQIAQLHDVVIAQRETADALARQALTDLAVQSATAGQKDVSVAERVLVSARKTLEAIVDRRFARMARLQRLGEIAHRIERYGRGFCLHRRVSLLFLEPR